MKSRENEGCKRKKLTKGELVKVAAYHADDLHSRLPRWGQCQVREPLRVMGQKYKKVWGEMTERAAEDKANKLYEPLSEAILFRLLFRIVDEYTHPICRDCPLKDLNALADLETLERWRREEEKRMQEEEVA